MDEIYEYNGKKYTLAQLQEKYGDKVNDAISKFGFTKVEQEPQEQSETFTYKDKSYTRAELEAKYGDKTEEAIEKFGFTSNLKKKANSKSIGEDTKLDSEAKEENGLSGTPNVVELSPEDLGNEDKNAPVGNKEIVKSNKFTERNNIANDNIANTKDAAKLKSDSEFPEYQSKELNEQETVEARIRKEQIDDARVGFKEAVTFTDDDNNEVEQRVKDEETTGFWDYAKQGAISTANAIKQIGTFGLGDSIENPTKTPFQAEIKEIKKEAIRTKEKLSDEEVLNRAKSLFKEKQEDFIYTDKANTFLENLPPETRTALKIESSESMDKLSFENKKRMKVNQALSVNLKENNKELKRLEEQFRDNTNITQEDVDAYNELRQETVSNYNQINKNYEKLIDNQEDLLSAEKEYDLFKRTYDYNFLGNTALTTAELGVGMVDFANYLGNATSISKQLIDTKEVRDNLSEEREGLRKTVGSVESVDGFVNYMSDLVANQLPILAVTSTGYGGLAALGASSTGQKFSEMTDENNDSITPANYSNMQMIGVPLLHGTAEAVFELPTLSILKKGKRVLNAAAKESSDLFRKSSTQQTKEVFGDFLKENLAEQGTNLIQNAANIYGLGKEGHITDNALDILKDTSALTGLLQGAPHLAGAALKPFQSKDQLKTLEVNAAKMLDLSKQLETPNITATEQQVIESQIKDLNTESSQIMNKTIGDVSKMPEEMHKEILKINEEAGQLRKQAEDIYVNGTTSNKEDLIKSITEKHNALQERRTAIVNGEIKIEPKNAKSEEATQEETKSEVETETPSTEVKQESVEPTETGVEDVKSPDVELKEGETTSWNLFGNEDSSEWVIGKKTKTRKGEEAVELSQKRTTTNGMVMTETHIVPISQLNESTPTNNTESDGSVPIGDTPNIQQGKDNNVQKPVEPRASESETEVKEKITNLDDIADFISKTYIKDEKASKPKAETNERAIKNSPDENINVPKRAEGKEKVIVVSKKGRTPLAKRAFKGDRKLAVEIEPSDANTLSLSYFAKGGKISSSYFKSKGELKARNNGINGIATKKAKNIDAIAHDIWQSNENKNLKLSTSEIKNALESVINENNTVQDIVATLLKNQDSNALQSPQEVKDYYDAAYEVQEVENAQDEELQEALGVLDQLDDTEIIELAESQQKSFEDYIEDIDQRRVSYTLGAFNETGTIQPDGYILSDNGDLLSPESVSNVKQVNPDAKPKQSNKITETPEIKEVNKQIEDANNKLRVAKDALDRKAKKLDKDLVNDNEDLFGERASANENSLFDERVDQTAREKATEKERQAIKDITNDIKKLNTLKTKLEKGDIKSTKEIAFNNIDNAAQWLKDSLPSVKGDDNLHVQGISQDQLIDLIAKAVKQLVSTGIDVNTAIKKVLKDIKDKFDVDINPEDVKAKMSEKPPQTPKKSKKANKNKNPKTEESFRDKIKQIPHSNEFGKYLSGETILKVEGGELRNDQTIEVFLLDQAANHGVETVEMAKEFYGKKYVEKTLEYLDKANLEPHEKAITYVSLENEMRIRVEENQDNVGEKKLQDLVRAKSQAHLRSSSLSINAGRLRAILKDKYIPESVTNQMYSPEQLVGKNKIQKAIEANMDEINNEAEAKYTDIEKRLEEAEKRAKKAEDELAIKNIQEDIDRKKRKNKPKRTYNLTKEEKTEYNQIRKELFGVFNDVSRMAAILADPKFRRYLQLAFKSVKGDFQKFSDKVVKEIGESAKKHIPELFKEANRINKESIIKTVEKSKDGKIEIPTELFRYYVEQGETDIDVISALIKEDIKDDFPDADVRDIRDAISGYGKRINPSEDEIKKEMARLRSVGKLFSALDDALNNINPKKSGLQRPKPKQEMRELRKKIMQTINDNGLDAVDVDTEWKSGLQKIKEQLKNQIEDLDKQIKNKEKRKIDRNPVKLDAVAEGLKIKRDAKKKFLDELVGKPELTNEQRVERAEISLEKSINKLEKEIKNNQIAFSEKATPLTSSKLKTLREQKKALIETRNLMREQAGLIESRRLENTKQQVKNKIKDLKERLINKDFSKKETKTNKTDSELELLNAEKKDLLGAYNEASGKRVNDKIKSVEKQIFNLVNNIKKDNLGKNSPWSKKLSEAQNELKRLKEIKKQNEPKDKAKQAKQLVKEALIEQGFGREINVRVNEKDVYGNVVKDSNGRNKKVKERRTVLDWKKLAGEAGSIDNIRENVESVLKDKGYSDKDIKDMSKELENEYTDLRASVIEKSLNELERRNKDKKKIDIKSSSKRLAELFNYGLFEKESETYNNLINSALGFNDLDNKTFKKLQELAKTLAELYNQDISEIGLQTSISYINHEIARTLNDASFLQANKAYQLAAIVQEYINLSTRFLLHSLGQIIENPFSGYAQRIYSKLGYSFDKTDNKELSKQRRKISKERFKSIVRDGGNAYGDTSSLLINDSKVENWLNNKTNSEVQHSIISFYMGRAFLEGFDSRHKTVLTEKYFVHNLIKVLTHPSNENRMTKPEALSFVTEQLTGQSFEDAKNKAKEVTDKINKSAGRKVLSDKDRAISIFAQDIMKDTLLKGSKLTKEEVESSYNAAYKSAGKDLGHVSNNIASEMVGGHNNKIERNLQNAIKEKDWNKAAYLKLYQIFSRNIVNTFVGGGSNWVVLGLEKSGVYGVPLLALNRLRKSNKKIDLTTTVGLKNLEKTLTEDLDYKNSATRVVLGSALALLTATLAISTGADDDINEWLKKNPWAKKFFNKLAPEILIAILAYKNDEIGKYSKHVFNAKSEFFDLSNQAARSLTDLVSDKENKGSEAGKMIGGYTSFPAPVKTIEDLRNVYNWSQGNEIPKKSYKASGFWNGFFKGGLIEELGIEVGENQELIELKSKRIKIITSGKLTPARIKKLSEINKRIEEIE